MGWNGRGTVDEENRCAQSEVPKEKTDTEMGGQMVEMAVKKDQ